MTTKSITFAGWGSVTDVPCLFRCDGTIRWAENGYVPGYRICDGCGRHYELRDGILAANGRRDKITAKDRAENERRSQESDRTQTVWQLIYAVQHALPSEQNGRVFGPEYDNSVSGDDLPALQAAEAAAQKITGTVNIGLAAGATGIAERIATMRRIAYPQAWAVYEEFRAALPLAIKIAVSADAATIRLTGQWTLGSYPVEKLRAALPLLQQWAGDLISHPLHAAERVSAMVG